MAVYASISSSPTCLRVHFGKMLLSSWNLNKPLSSFSFYISPQPCGRLFFFLFLIFSAQVKARLCPITNAKSSSLVWPAPNDTLSMEALFFIYSLTPSRLVLLILSTAPTHISDSDTPAQLLCSHCNYISFAAVPPESLP